MVVLLAIVEGFSIGHRLNISPRPLEMQPPSTLSAVGLNRQPFRRDGVYKTVMAADQYLNSGDSSDSEDRVQDFWARHGGPAAQPRAQGETIPGLSGWTEVYAVDGYVLRCDWSKAGTLNEMRYTERAPNK